MAGTEGAEPGAGGLELQDYRTGAWAPVPAPEGSLTINIGDLLARWTNDRWRAGVHRVPAPTGAAAARNERTNEPLLATPPPTPSKREQQATQTAQQSQAKLG